ncbi:hypothetical protein BRD05_09520 [Halobacteriales archaeon QS_9_70_65]|nr:MAG: hypothetical protein BRD05_09520 [Halobacteriales archaeon QS_9_70_65]
MDTDRISPYSRRLPDLRRRRDAARPLDGVGTGSGDRLVYDRGTGDAWVRSELYLARETRVRSPISRRAEQELDSSAPRRRGDVRRVRHADYRRR